MCLSAEKDSNAISYNKTITIERAKDMASSKSSSWKGSINRKKNCMTLFKVLKHLFHRSLPEPQIVKAAEDIEYKLMVENGTKKMFESDLARVVVGLRNLTSFKSKKAAKTQLRGILKSIGTHKPVENKQNATFKSSGVPTLPSLSLELDLNPDELKMIEKEAMIPTSPIPPATEKGEGSAEESKTWPTKNNPFMHKEYVLDSPETRNKKLKQLSKNNRYIQYVCFVSDSYFISSSIFQSSFYRYYQTLSDKYFPKLMGILDDIVHKCKSEKARYKVKMHFEALVKYLRGDGEPVTPVSVYVCVCVCVFSGLSLSLSHSQLFFPSHNNRHVYLFRYEAKEKLKRLFFWYQKNLMSRMSEKRIGEAVKTKEKMENEKRKLSDEKGDGVCFFFMPFSLSSHIHNNNNNNSSRQNFQRPRGKS